MLVAQALTPTVRSGNSGLLGGFRIESLTCPSKPDTARPTQLTSTGRGCSHQPGHPSQEFHISSAGASRTRALSTGSPALYQLSYGTGSVGRANKPQTNKPNLRRDGTDIQKKTMPVMKSSDIFQSNLHQKVIKNEKNVFGIKPR